MDGENVDSEDYFTEAELVEKMLGKLQSERILIEELDYPRIDEVPSLTVSDKEIDFDFEKKHFFDLGLKEYNQKLQAGYLYTYNTDSSLDILYYGDTEKIKTRSYDTALKIAEKYVKPELNNIKFEYHKHKELEDGSYEFYFEESFKDIRILDGYIIVQVKGDKVLNIKQKIVDIKEDKEKIQRLIPYSLVLYNLYGMIGESHDEIKITEINVVEELTAKNEEKNLVSGETFVYYRFMTDKGESYLIDAIDSDEK